MSQKKIKDQKPGQQTPLAVAGVPKELMDVPATFKLVRQSGNENYSAALQCLINRFATSDYAKKSGKSPHQLVLEGIHSLINILNDVYPRNSENRPLGVPEVALLFGAVLGTAAAPAYVHGEASMADIDAQVELFWVSVREWLAKGFFAVKHIETQGLSGGASKLIIPGGVH